MKNKVVLVGIAARNALVKGAEFVAQATVSSLGPYGANFAIEKNNEVTNDGVTIAKEIVSGGIHDESEARGARMILEASSKTDEIAGDGTTTAMALAISILKECLKYLPKDDVGAGKKKPSEIVAQVEKERKEITEKLVAMATPIDTEEELIRSAIVSVGDEELGKLIGKAQFEIGKDGVLIAEDTNEKYSYNEREMGIKIDNGFVTSLAINNQEKQSLELKDIRILLTNHVFMDMSALNEARKALYQSGVRMIVVVGRGFSEKAVQECMEMYKNGYPCYPINAPYTDQNEIMKDLIAILGGKYINNEESEISATSDKDFGFATKIIAKRFETIFGGKDDVDSRMRVTARVEELQAKLKGSTSDFERKNLELRISQLVNGISVIKIGATSELRQKYLKRKADDAVNAVRAAFKEGVVEGAGLAFKKISEELPESYILKEPLMSIYKQIMFSAPSDFKIEDWVKDPVFVLRTALENACGVATTLATTRGTSNTAKDKPLDVLLRKAVVTETTEG